MIKIIPVLIFLIISLFFSTVSPCLEIPLKEVKTRSFHQKYYPPKSFYGSFKVEGTDYTIVITDFNRNGKINDPQKITSNPKSPNLLTVSRTGDLISLSSGEETDYSDYQVFGEFLLIGSKVFEFKVVSENRKIILDEIKNGLFPLKLSMRPERFSLVSENGHCLMAYKPISDLIMLPEGKYRLMDYQVLRTDAKKNKWHLKAEGTFHSSLVTVGPGFANTLLIGDPFTPVVASIRVNNNTLTGKDAVRLIFSLEGSGGERITDLRCDKGNKGSLISILLYGGSTRRERPQKPSYTIFKPDGGIVAKGFFEYG
jgi:hypothetical protein